MTRSEALAAVTARIASTPAAVLDRDPRPDLDAATRREERNARRREAELVRAEKREAARAAVRERMRERLRAAPVWSLCVCGCGRWFIAAQPGQKYAIRGRCRDTMKLAAARAERAETWARRVREGA